MISDGGSAILFRLRMTIIILIGLLALLVGRIFELQIIQGAEHRKNSEKYYIVPAEIKAPRGDIVDCNGSLIAGSRQAFSICGIPRSLLHRRDEIDVLSRILGVEEDFIRNRLKLSSCSYRPTVIVRDVDFGTVSMVEEMFNLLPDVLVVAEPIRFYPLARLASHVVGYVGEVTQEDIAKGKGYDVGDLIGKTGIEKEYENYLKGQDGLRYLMFNPSGGSGPVEYEREDSRPPRKGRKIELTIDMELQKYASELLEDRCGAVIAISTESGNIILVASSPGFDPNRFATGISSSDWQEIVEDHDNPLLNRAIQSTYPPGSIFKIVTAGIGLEEGVVTEGSRFKPCSGSYRFGNRTFACWKRQGHGSLDLVGAIAVSCDVYFYQLGEHLALELFDRYAERWKINTKTGIDLPGELSGFVPKPSDYDRLYGKGQWTRGVQLNLAIGQGELLLTPIEICCFIAAIANGGYYYKPHCLERIQGLGDWVVKKPERIDLPISSSTIDVLRKAMLQVVERPHGTGSAARIAGIKVAGKTGTAQNPHGKDHASFVCFAPYDDPLIVLYVIVENSGHGGEIAAPIAGKILRRILERHYGLTLACQDKGK